MLYEVITLSKQFDIHTLVINGGECEPYLSCDDRLMREQASKIIGGIRYLLQATGAPRITSYNVCYTKLLRLSYQNGDNIPPSAYYSYSCSGQSCDFDGSASSDSDGTIASYT